MTVSYNWLCEYLPKSIEPEVLSNILTGIGLEVESLTKFEEVKGGLEGLVVGEVLSCEKHPDADKLKLTVVNIGLATPLNIVCGAPNVAVGQKVIVAPIGCTIYPISGDPVTMKKAKIRGKESEGMICAEDEIGMGSSHDGIKILPESSKPGTPLKELFQPYQDYVFEIGLTPNRMDAMSHIGVARDVCAYLSYHENIDYRVKLPFEEALKNPVNKNGNIELKVEDNDACKRYAGLLIANIKVAESPAWLQQRLKSIGQKPINNIVDITNFILHETGQPLHAFDADAISGNKIIVKKANAGMVFQTLDEKEIKLSEEDLMICNDQEPMCIAGVYGGFKSGVKSTTTAVFIESAYFNAASIRKTSLRHGLRTEAAGRFEKGVDMSNTVKVLLRAAKMIEAIAGGNISSSVMDNYPVQKEKTTVSLDLNYLKKLSGKNYTSSSVERILKALGFEIISKEENKIALQVPFSKNDISIQADVVEEIMRIDGLDQVEIPESITISPSVEKNHKKYLLREKLSNQLAGSGFHEMFTNSITNSAFYNELQLEKAVKMINSLSNELNMLRPEMLQSGLQVIAHNINRKNNNLMLFEFGKTYHQPQQHSYTEQQHLALYISGNVIAHGWNSKPQKADLFYLKGITENLLRSAAAEKISFVEHQDANLVNATNICIREIPVGIIGEVSPNLLKAFDIKQPVFFADLKMDELYHLKSKPILYKEITKFPTVNRDLALVVDKNVSYSQIERIALSTKINQLTNVQLFDIFESEKIGAGKKSMALSFTFIDEQKTLTDQEIEGFMQKIIGGYEKQVGAEIRK
jgi:phenylalanyl-tRNA synthetase beta chain